LQFHIEATPASVAELVAQASHEIGIGRFQQKPHEIIAATPQSSAEVGPVLTALLDLLASGRP
jgi:hypothetical protein